MKSKHLLRTYVIFGFSYLTPIINFYYFSSIKSFVMKNPKKKKDPLAPKKPLSAFLEFSIEERPKVVAEMGQISFSEVGKELGSRWRNLSLEKKEVYQEKSKNNAKKHADELELYGKRKGEVTCPQAPLNCYLEFAKVERTRILGEKGALSHDEMERELSLRWKNISKEEKDMYKGISNENERLHERRISETGRIPAPVAIDEEESSSPPDQEMTDIASDQAAPKPQTVETKILASDLGFAKQAKYEWHPALKTGMNPRGSRISVTYLGTAQTGIVDRGKWLPFSRQAEVKITTPRLLKDNGFRRGMDQLRNLLSKINSTVDKSTTKANIGFSSQPVGRKLVKLTKEGLQKDEEQNLRMMKERIVALNEETYKWGCRICKWKGKYKLGAKMHARECGSRRREKKKKPKDKKYECSRAGCDVSFPYLSQLQKHYR